MATDDKSILLARGNLKVTGRLVDASNATLYATAIHEDEEVVCIYKPVAGERPLWDFSDGCLAHREYAAYLVSEQLGFNCVPLTILRDGPYGFGMVQQWINIDETIDLGELFSTDHPQLRAMALFDAIINNTDRKIGHLLPLNKDQILGCDHGVTFHAEDKLRTVLWQWAGDDLSSNELSLLKKAQHAFSNDLAMKLEPYLTTEEIEMCLVRINRLIAVGKFPEPNPNWPAVPWPAF
jgi:uncharacterized repeat protein (TIGR03843 family)